MKACAASADALIGFGTLILPAHVYASHGGSHSLFMMPWQGLTCLAAHNNCPEETANAALPLALTVTQKTSASTTSFFASQHFELSRHGPYTSKPII